MNRTSLPTKPEPAAESADLPASITMREREFYGYDNSGPADALKSSNHGMLSLDYKGGPISGREGELPAIAMGPGGGPAKPASQNSDAPIERYSRDDLGAGISASRSPQPSGNQWKTPIAGPDRYGDLAPQSPGLVELSGSQPGTFAKSIDRAD